jgi:uncharacterized protein with beta-barrel porin domain
MILHNSKRRSWHLILASVAVFGLTQFCQLGQPSAQTLNDAVDSLLANDCAKLNPIRDTLGGGTSSQFSNELNALCLSAGFGSALTTGGGAASLQGSAASILNRVLLQRLDETDEEEGQEHARSSSMRFNPFGSLLSGFGRTSSVSSPLYAATTASGGSTATFTSGSQSRWHGLGLFASGLVESLNRDVTTFQDGYKSNILGITAGADYRFNKKLVAGLALNYFNTDGDFRSGGNFSTNSYGGLLFASYRPTDKIFVQVIGGYTKNNYLVSRLASASRPNIFGSPFTVQGPASSQSDGNVFNLGLMTGYDHPIGRFTVGPRVGMNYSNTKIGDYGENGSTGVELRYDNQWINSLQSVLGVQGSAAFSTGLGVLVPQFNADFVHEFANSQRFINVQFAQDFRTTPTKFTFQNDVPVRNYFNLGTGLLMVLPNGWQPFVNFRAMVGNEQFNNYAGMFGLRTEL